MAIAAGLCARIERSSEESGFSGVVSVGHLGQPPWVLARGFADRARGVANAPETQLAIASGTKTLTALAVMSLVAQGKLALDSDVQEVLGGDSGLVQRGVTIRHLLAHTSGIGDYLDEAVLADIESYALEIPSQQLAAPTDYLALLRGGPPKFSPGARFEYCNSGYVLLARLIEIAADSSYYDVIQDRVCAPAGLSQTAFYRMDALPRSTALGYLPSKGWTTNHQQLPVRGAGDGGAYSTAGDIAGLWSALVAGRIVPLPLVEEMLHPQHEGGSEKSRYGLGVWLSRARPVVFMEGQDAGISFRSTFEPSTGLVCTVLSNTTRGAWPLVSVLDAALGAGGGGSGSNLIDVRDGQ